MGNYTAQYPATTYYNRTVIETQHKMAQTKLQSKLQLQQLSDVSNAFLTKLETLLNSSETNPRNGAEKQMRMAGTFAGSRLRP